LLRYGVVDSEVQKLQQHLQNWDSKHGSSNKISNSDVVSGGSEVAGNSGNNSYLDDDVGKRLSPPPLAASIHYKSFSVCGHRGRATTTTRTWRRLEYSRTYNTRN
jgi:hypothetical protein